MNGLTTIASIPRSAGAGSELKAETHIRPRKYATGAPVSIDVDWWAAGEARIARGVFGRLQNFKYGDFTRANLISEEWIADAFRRLHPK